jgi:hypothetical protein
VDLERRETALLFDFFALFIESCILLGLAATITKPHVFAWSFPTLLLVDISWAALTVTIFRTGDGLVAHRDWVLLNAATSVLLIALLGLSGLPNGTPLKATILAVAVGRTILDYALSWQFYADRDGLQHAE